MSPNKNPSKKKTAKLPLPVDILLNTGKNIGSGLAEYIKEILPTSFSIYEESKASINEISGSFKNTSSQVASTFKSIFRLETFKTIGRWYMNKENDFGMGDIDDSLDFDVGSDFNEGEYESFISSVEENRDKELEKASDKISETVVETSHKLMETQVASLASITNSMEKTVSVVTTGFETVNKTLQEILEVVTKNSSALIELSSRMTGKESDEYNSRNNDRFDFKSFLNNFSFENYFKLVKSNFNNQSGELGQVLSFLPMASSFLTMGNPGQIHGLFKSGISWLTNAMLPGFNNTFKKLDAAINKEITRGLLALGNMQDDYNPIVSFLAKIFGVTGDFRNKAGFKTPSFRQEAIPFDTKTKEYITKAIPEYLRTITAAITGRDLVYDINSRTLREQSKVVNEQRARIYDAATRHLHGAFDSDDFKNAGIDDKFNRNDVFYKKYLNIVIDYLINLAESNYNDFSNDKLFVNLRGASNDDLIFKAIFDFLAPKNDDLKKELLNLNEEDRNKIITIGKLIQLKTISRGAKQYSTQAYQYKRELINLGAIRNNNLKWIYDDIAEQYQELIEPIKKGISNKVYKNAINTNIIVESLKEQIEDINRDKTKSDEDKKAEKERLENEIIEVAKKFKEELKPEEPNKLDKINFFVGDKEFTTDQISLLPDKNGVNFSINTEVHIEDIVKAINENTVKIVDVLKGIKVVSDKSIEAKSKETSDISTTNNLLSNIDKTITNINESYNKNHEIIFNLLSSKFDNIIENFKRGVVTIDSGQIIKQSSSEAGKIGKTNKIEVDKITGEIKEKKDDVPVEKKPAANSQEDSVVTGIENASKNASEAKAAEGNVNGADKNKQDIRPIEEIQKEKIQETGALLGESVNVIKKAVRLTIDNKPNEAVGTLIGHGSEIGKNVLDILNPEFKLIGNNINAIFNGGKRNDRVFDNEGNEIGYKTREVTGVFPLVGNWLKTGFDKLFNKSDKKAIEASETALNEVSKNQPGAAISDKKKLNMSKIRRSITNAFIGATGGGILGGPIGLLLGTIAGGAASFINLDSKISDFLFGDFFNQSVKTKDRKLGFIEKEIRGWLIPWQYQFKRFQETMIYDFERYIVPAWKSIAHSFGKLIENHFFRDLVTHIKTLPIWTKFLKPLGDSLLKVGKNLLLGLDNLAKGLLPGLFGVFGTGGAHATATVGGKAINKVAEWISDLFGTRKEHDNIEKNARNKAEEFKKSSKTLGGGWFNSGLFSPKERIFLKNLEDKYTNTFDSLRDAIMGEGSPAVTYYSEMKTTVNKVSENVEQIAKNTSSNNNEEKKTTEKTSTEEAKKSTPSNTETPSVENPPSQPTNTDEKSSHKEPGKNSTWWDKIKNFFNTPIAFPHATLAATIASDADTIPEANAMSAEITKAELRGDQKKSKGLLFSLVNKAYSFFNKNKKDKAAEGGASGKGGGGFFSLAKSFISDLFGAGIKDIPGLLLAAGLMYFGIKGILDIGPDGFINSLKALFGLNVPGNGGGGSGSGGSGSGGSRGPIIRSPIDEAARIIGYDGAAAAMWNPFAPIRYKDTNIVANNISNAFHTPEKMYAISASRNLIQKYKKWAISTSEGAINVELAETAKKLQELPNELQSSIDKIKKTEENARLKAKRAELEDDPKKVKQREAKIKSEKAKYAKKEKQLEKKIENLNKQHTKIQNMPEPKVGSSVLDDAYKGASKAKAELGKVAFKAGLGAIGGGMIARGVASTFYKDINREDYNTDEEYFKAVEQRDSALDTAQGVGAGVGGVTTAFKPTPKIANHIIKVISENLDKLKKLISTSWSNSKVAEAISSLFNKIKDIITPKRLAEIAKKQGAKLSNILAKAGLNVAGLPAVAITAGITGAASAIYSTEWMFGVMPKDVDFLMRSISLALGGIFDGTAVGILELVDLIIDPIFHVGLRQLIARSIYKVLEDPTNTLEDKQKRLKEQKDAYNAKYGKNLTDAQFNDMVNPRALSSMWTGKTKLDKNGNFMYDENGNVIKTGGFTGALGFGSNTSYARDSAGNVIRDKRGKAVANVDRYGNELKDDHGFGKFINNAWRGAGAWLMGSKHNYATDKNGNAIFARNADGSIKYDENGNPVYADMGPSEGVFHKLINAIEYGFTETGKWLSNIWNGVVTFFSKTLPEWWAKTKTWAHRGITEFILKRELFLTEQFNNVLDGFDTFSESVLGLFPNNPGFKEQIEYLETKKHKRFVDRANKAREIMRFHNKIKEEDKEFEVASTMTDIYSNGGETTTTKNIQGLSGLIAGGKKFKYSIGNSKHKTDITLEDINSKLHKHVTTEEYTKLRKKGFSHDQIMLLPYDVLKDELSKETSNGKYYNIYIDDKKIEYNPKAETSTTVNKLVNPIHLNDKEGPENTGEGGPEPAHYSMKKGLRYLFDHDYRKQYDEAQKKTFELEVARYAKENDPHFLDKMMVNSKKAKENESKVNKSAKTNQKSKSTSTVNKSNKNDKNKTAKTKIVATTSSKKSNTQVVATKMHNTLPSESTKTKTVATTSSETKSAKIVNSNGKYKYPCDRVPEVTSPYGVWRNGKNGRYRHSGVDLGLNYESILACCDGFILDIGTTSESGGYGNFVLQSSPDNVYGILYAHLSDNSIKCKVGDHVSQGQVLGTSGDTGHSFGPHLHLEFRGFNDKRKMTKDGFWWGNPRPKTMNPLDFINGKNTATSNSNEEMSYNGKTKKGNEFSLGLLSLIPGFDILSQGIDSGLSSLLGLLGFISSPTSDSTPYNGTYTPISNGTIEQNRKAIYSFLRKKKLSPEGASAVVGNLFAESSLNPTIENEIGAYGIAQWLDDRRVNLKRSQPNDYNTLDGQLQFLYKELNNYPSLLKALRAPGGNTAALAERFCREFERPSEKEIIQSLPTRTSYANETLKKNWGGPEPIRLKDMNSIFSNIKSTNIDIPNPVDSLINVLNNILNELKQIKGINSTNTNIMGGMASGSIRQKEQVKTLLNRINNFTTSHTPVSQQINSNIINFVKGI